MTRNMLNSAASCIAWTRFARAVTGAIVLISALLMSFDSFAEGGDADAAEFVPPADGFDWIELTSGEWLKGEIIALYDEEMRFDSEILNMLEIDLEDVRTAFGRHRFGVGLEGYGTIVGEFRISAQTVSIVIENQIHEYPRWRLISLTKAADKEIDRWSADLGLAFSARRGNTDIAEFNMLAGLERRTARTRLLLDYLGNVNETDNVTIANNHRVNMSFDIFRGGRWFWRPFRGQYYRDPIQNISGQVTAETGLGYRLSKTPRTDWEVSAGIGGNYVRYESVEAGEDDREQSPVVSFGTVYEFELTSWMDYLFEFKMSFLNEDSGAYQHHLLTTLSTDLIGNLDLDVTFVWDRTQEPQQRADGTTPEKDDYRLLVGLGLEF